MTIKRIDLQAAADVGILQAAQFVVDVFQGQLCVGVCADRVGLRADNMIRRIGNERH
jgi:hypothetical protein